MTQLEQGRIQELDALRGFALFGILLVNIFVFHAPYCYYGEFYGALEGFQGLTLNAVIAMAGGKFMFIFSFLFGYGIQLQRNSRIKEFNNYFVKRMLILLIFGALHILFFWVGDILASYALLGLLVLPFLKMPQKYILFLGLFFLLFRPLYYFGSVAFDWPSVHEFKPASLEEFITVFQQGSYFEIFKLRMLEFAAFIPENLVWYIPKSFGLFFLGIYASKKAFFQQLRTKRSKLGITAIVLILISFVWNYFKGNFFQSFDLEAEPMWRPVLIFINVCFETAQGIGYIVGLSILFHNQNWLTRLFAQTGRLALTNYILQSFICVLLFYGYGFGLYTKLSATTLVVIATAVYVLNLLFSYFYLIRWQTGPLEYLWKSRLK